MNKSTAISYIDLLFCLFTFFVVAFAILYAANLKTQAGNIEAKAEYMVIVDWADASTNDIDVWMKDPAGNIVAYKDREAGTMTLDRDDMGTHGPTDPIRREIITVRSSMAGEYVVNLMLFAKRAGNENVKVTVMKINPFRNILEKSFVMDTDGQELTAVIFVVDNDGNIIKVDTNRETTIGLKTAAGE